MMKAIFIFLLTSLITNTSFGQMNKDEIKLTFEKYFESVEQKENEKTLEYIYPKLFEIYPKNKMLEAMNEMKADTTTAITISNDSIIHISETFELEGIKYALIKYSFKMTMKFSETKNETESSENEDFNKAELSYELLKEVYGEKNTIYNKENSTIYINVSNEMFAIKNPSYNDWKFLENKENMKPILEKLLPKKVLKKWQE
jgi:hypothetical protein